MASEDFPPRGSGAVGHSGGPPNRTWAGPHELSDAWRWEPGKILLGEGDGRILGRRETRHIVTVAGSQAGKSSTVLTPNLLRYPGSALVLDPKGELTRRTAADRRAMGHQVFVLDPFGETDEPCAMHNPMEELGRDRANQMAADAALLADGLIVSNEKDPHWTDAAKNLIRGITLYLLAVEPARANLRTLRELLNTDMATFENLLKAMAGASPDLFDGVVRNTGTSFFAKMKGSEREFHSILSTAQEQTAPLDDILSITDWSSFSLADLKKGPTTVYLVLPGMRMGTHFRWLRVLVQQALAAMERTGGRADPPVWFVLEEFAALGHLRSLETAAGFIAGFGVQLWSVIQDFTQLKTHYPNSWETFLGNAGILQAFGNVDLTTTDYLSRRMGNTQALVKQDVFVAGQSLGHGDTGAREHWQNVRLLDPDEITFHFAANTNRQLILMPGRPPIYMNRLPPNA